MVSADKLEDLMWILDALRRDFGRRLGNLHRVVNTWVRRPSQALLKELVRGLSASAMGGPVQKARPFQPIFPFGTCALIWTPQDARTLLDAITILPQRLTTGRVTLSRVMDAPMRRLAITRRVRLKTMARVSLFHARDARILKRAILI